MDTKDIHLYESGDGGEMLILNNDLALTELLLQQVYIALFGGNVEANTDNNVLPTEQRFDWWGNGLFFTENQSEQFNSNTERTLNTTTLNSAGRLTILSAVQQDLSYLSDVANATYDVELLTYNRVRIIVNFTPKDNQQNKVLQLVYDNAKNELIIEQVI